MSVAAEIERLQGLKTRLRTKLISMLGLSSTATLESCVEAVENITDQGTVSGTINTDATTYCIPQGYHDGKGTVSVELEEKSVTPTKAAQMVTPGAGKVLSKVTVAAIPDNYGDVSDVDLTAEYALSGKKFVDSNGALKTGAMTNNGTVAATIDGLTVTSYTVPKGYHSGTGTVSMTSDIENALAAI